jgi:hypothetical protein
MNRTCDESTHVGSTRDELHCSFYENNIVFLLTLILLTSYYIKIIIKFLINVQYILVCQLVIIEYFVTSKSNKLKFYTMKNQNEGDINFLF